MHEEGFRVCSVDSYMKKRVKLKLKVPRGRGAEGQ